VDIRGIWTVGLMKNRKKYVLALYAKQNFMKRIIRLIRSIKNKTE
jgi:hypothetical protein